MSGSTPQNIAGRASSWTLLWLALGLATTTAHAGTLYVTPEGAGAGDGQDWLNAFAGFSEIAWDGLGAGDQLCVGGGTYDQSLSIDSSGSAAQPLIVRRATANDTGCATAAGWQQALDTQVRLEGASISVRARSHVIVDGVVEHGIFINAVAGQIHGVRVSDASADVTIQYITVDGDNEGDAFRGLYLLGADGVSVRHTVVQNIPNDAVVLDGTGHLFEHNTFGPRIPSASGKHADAFEIRATDDVVYRYNIMDWDGDGLHFGIVSASTGSWDVHGNVFTGRTALKTNSVDPVVGPIHIYNNSFSDLYLFFAAKSRTTYDAKNNLFFNVENGASHVDNHTATTNPFVDSSSHDYHLREDASARNVGLTLDANVATDPDGNTRGADGLWDTGAYEFSDTLPPPVPSPPLNLRVLD